MPNYALIKAGVFQEVRVYDTQPPDIPHKQVVWLPFVVVTPPSDPATQVVDYQIVISPTQVTRQGTVRNLTAQELDAIAYAKVDDLAKVAFEAIFNHENRIRALESKGPITKQQLRDALRAFL